MNLVINKYTGIVQQAQWIASPNHDQRPDQDDINAVIIHAISLPPGCYEGEYVEALFTNCLNPWQHPYFKEIENHKVSAHFYIRRDGELIQFVSILDRAWHAGESTLHGRTKVNDFSVGIELEGCDTDQFKDRQYTQLAALTRSLMSIYSAIKIENIAGHSDIAPGRKTDPGPGFDWEKYRKMLT